MNNKQKLYDYIDNDIKTLGLDSRTQTLMEMLLVISYNLGYEQALAEAQYTMQFYELKR